MTNTLETLKRIALENQSGRAKQTKEDREIMSAFITVKRRQDEISEKKFLETVNKIRKTRERRKDNYELNKLLKEVKKC